MPPKRIRLSPYIPFLHRFTDHRALELRETEILYRQVRRAHKKSPYASPHRLDAYNDAILDNFRQNLKQSLPRFLIDALSTCQRRVLELEDTIFGMPEVDLRSALLSAKDLVDLRRFLRAKEHFLANEERVIDRLLKVLMDTLGAFPTEFPPIIDDPNHQRALFTIPLISTAFNPALLVEKFIGTFSDPDNEKEGVFVKLRYRLYENACEVAGIAPYGAKPLVPTTASTMEGSPVQLVEKYLKGTPFYDLLVTPIPLHLPQSTRFEHHWIVAGSGHGKTQTLQYLISRDLEAVARDEATIVVLDSQGDLIRTISRLRFFADHPDKLCLIDPTDIEYPVALNLFDINMERLRGYSPLDRERLTNSILELYDFVIGSLLSAELTQKQSTIFRYITRLMLHIPDANIQTLRELMESGGYEKHKHHIQKLQGTARAFFETEFQSKQFEDTKRQVVRRLWGILENQTFERMFSHPRNKLDLFSEMNSGKVILINTAKELLKQNGCEIFGRFFVAMIAQCAQERATLQPEQRLPTFVYVDECQDYLDQNVALILEQARKFKVGMILAHQYLGQLPQRLHESFAANTSIKMAGGISDRDAKAFASMMRTSADFIERQPKGYFATFVRNVTKEALSLRVPFGVLEQMPKTIDAEWKFLRDSMRQNYAVHYSEVQQIISRQLSGTLDDGATRDQRDKLGAATDSKRIKAAEQKKADDIDNIDTGSSERW